MHVTSPPDQGATPGHSSGDPRSRLDMGDMTNVIDPCHMTMMLG